MTPGNDWPCALLLAAVLALPAGAAGGEDAAAAATEQAVPALRWSEALYRWHYHRAAEPAWLDPGLGLHLFQSAAALWAACGVRIEYAGVTELAAGRADGANTAGWAPLQAGLRGLTTLRRKGAALLEADITINAANAQLRASPALLRKVVLHEFGHALGLVHSPDCTDVMSFGGACRQVLPADLPQRPAAGDLRQCSERYQAGAKQ
jgi:hypothetical protein